MLRKNLCVQKKILLLEICPPSHAQGNRFKCFKLILLSKRRVSAQKIYDLGETSR